LGRLASGLLNHHFHFPFPFSLFPPCNKRNLIIFRAESPCHSARTSLPERTHGLSPNAPRLIFPPGLTDSGNLEIENGRSERTPPPQYSSHLSHSDRSWGFVLPPCPKLRISCRRLRAVVGGGFFLRMILSPYSANPASPFLPSPPSIVIPL